MKKNRHFDVKDGDLYKEVIHWMRNGVRVRYTTSPSANFVGWMRIDVWCDDEQMLRIIQGLRNRINVDESRFYFESIV